MSNLTLRIDDELLAAARKKAAMSGTTVNRLIRDFLANFAGGETPDAKQARKELAEMARASTVDFGPDWKWNREDIYAERLSRFERVALRGDNQPDRSGKEASGGRTD